MELKMDEFFKAIRENNIRDVRRIIENNKDIINSQNKDGQTALMIACRYSSDDMVRLLLEYGADIGLKDAEGHTALQIAFAEEEEEVVNMIKAAHTADRLLAGKNIGAVIGGQETLFMERSFRFLYKDFDKTKYERFVNYCDKHGLELLDEYQELLEISQEDFEIDVLTVVTITDSVPLVAEQWFDRPGLEFLKVGSTDFC